MKSPTTIIIHMELKNPLLTFGTAGALLVLYFHSRKRAEGIREKNIPSNETHK